MISMQVESVNNTQLFCGVNSNRTRQITVYANAVNNVSDMNAMVLPVPFPESIEFHNLSDYKYFFKDCEKCFYKPMPKNYGDRDSTLISLARVSANSTLDVINVGSYKVSVANNLADLSRIDSNVFDLSDGLADVLKKNYSNPHFGFIICKLAKGKESYHPFAYSHKIFDSKVFIPTKHYHEHIDNNNNYFGKYASFGFMMNNNDSGYADDWEHDIYLYNVSSKNNQKVQRMDHSEYEWNKKNHIKFDKIDFDLPSNCKIFQKMQINGSHPNIDIILQAV